ncbi:MAG: response regulator transcription factor [Woeseia sp.]
MIRILIADDHALIREGLRKIFEQHDDMEVVGEAQNAEQAVSMTRDGNVDLALIDMNMPGVSGFEALQQIVKREPKIPVLVLSMLPESDYALRILKAGAAGFLSKSTPPDEIVAAVRQVAAGEKYVGAVAAERLASELSQPEDVTPHAQLSNREFQVLRMIASGKGTRLISEELKLSVNTVATYRRRILQKLQLSSDVEVAHFAVEHRLLD